jgi:hypothetical protein
MRFLLDARFVGRFRERGVDTGSATVDDDQVRAVSREQTVHDLLRQLIASRVPIARN